jgi:hypothetical protein
VGVGLGHGGTVMNQLWGSEMEEAHQGGFAHDGGESAEWNQLGCHGPVAKGPSGLAGER